MKNGSAINTSTLKLGNKVVVRIKEIDLQLNEASFGKMAVLFVYLNTE